ncbi:hypothetical protein ACHQM5_000641 [Ranunculus cassubicifolius]
MAKKSQKRLSRLERSQSGCMSGWISIFDFRQGRSSRKLLSDKRHGSSRHPADTGTASCMLKPLSGSDKKHQRSKSNVDNLPSSDSDKKHQRSKSSVDYFSDSDEPETLTSGISKLSVKTLIAEDMSSEEQTEKQIPKGNQGKNQKQTKKTRKVASDIHAEDTRASVPLDSQEYFQSNLAKKLSLLDITSLIEEFCSQIRRQEIHLHNESSESTEEHSVLQEMLTEAAEAFLSQKLSDTKQLTDDGAINQSKQFIDAVEILNSNKELLLKLLQDSSSQRVNNIQDLQLPPSEKVKQDKVLAPKMSKQELASHKEVQRHNIHNFFRKKDKSHKRDSLKESDDSQVSNRIVVLKPKATPVQNSISSTQSQGWSGRFNYQVSLGLIKRKLKNTMGENKHQVSVDQENKTDIDLPSKSHLDMERTAKLSNNGSREVGVEKAAPCYHEVASSSAAAGYPKKRESNIYIEAKRHLEEMLIAGDEEGSFSSVQSPKTLGRILSLPEYNSTPIYSPRRDGEDGFITAQMRLSSSRSFQIVNENIWRFRPDINPNRLSQSRKSIEIQQDDPDSHVSDIELKDSDSIPEIHEKLLPPAEIHEELIPKGDGEIMEEGNAAYLEEDNLFDEPSISNSMEEESRESFQEDLKPSTSICSNSSIPLLIQKSDSLENINDLPDRPSPVSVLETFSDDTNSSATTTPQAELQNQRLHFDVEDDSCSCSCSTMVVSTSSLHNHRGPWIQDSIPPFKYVSAILQASKVNWEELHSSEFLIDPSLYDEINLISDPHYGDRKVLFDCINEVLGELYERYFGSSPWVGFVNRDIRPAPMGKSIIIEVWEGINWNLLPPLMPRSLDQIIEKDMEKSRTWMDLRPDTESIGSEMVEFVVDELIEEALFDIWMDE